MDRQNDSVALPAEVLKLRRGGAIHSSTGLPAMKCIQCDNDSVSVGLPLGSPNAVHEVKPAVDRLGCTLVAESKDKDTLMPDL
jgi:hypothetical protein